VESPISKEEKETKEELTLQIRVEIRVELETIGRVRSKPRDKLVSKPEEGCIWEMATQEEFNNEGTSESPPNAAETR
jgi:hypothetical protein